MDTLELDRPGASYTVDTLRELADHLDHNNLNDLPPFDEIEPSAENQAKYFYDEMKRRLPPRMADAIVYARVWETPTQWAQYTERQLWV